MMPVRYGFVWGCFVGMLVSLIPDNEPMPLLARVVCIVLTGLGTAAWFSPRS